MDASAPDFDALLRRWEAAAEIAELVAVLRALCGSPVARREARVVHLVLEALDHADVVVRIEALGVVARCPWDTLLEAVEEVAEADPDPEVRAAAARLRAGRGA